jgi:hypothetical protein
MKCEDIKIKVRTDFSESPGPRRPDEGDNSGEEFRKNVLLPALQRAVSNKVQLIVDLDNTDGFGTSFLEESFGGLIRHNGYTEKQLKNTLVIISDEWSDYIDEINLYIAIAEQKEAAKRK